MNPQRDFPILLVEDDPGDVLMTREALAHHGVHNPLFVVADGIEALRFLRREGEHAAAPRPGLVLLDLNLPRLNGHELLTIIKVDDRLRTIPVIVLTSSASHDDVRHSYELHANAFVTKPVGFSRFADVIRCIDGFFVGVATLPHL